MAQVVNVTQDELRNTAKRIRTMADEYKKLYESDLYNEAINNQLKDAWHGEDQVSFTQRVESYKPCFQRMYELMTEYADHLEKAAGHYDATQDKIVAEAASL